MLFLQAYRLLVSERSFDSFMPPLLDLRELNLAFGATKGVESVRLRR